MFVGRGAVLQEQFRADLPSVCLPLADVSPSVTGTGCRLSCSGSWMVPGLETGFQGALNTLYVLSSSLLQTLAFRNGFLNVYLASLKVMNSVNY